MIAEIIKAYEFAKIAHGHQKRKYTGEPYINHPLAVANILYRCICWPTCERNSIMLQAAILHDVIEDTFITDNELYCEFDTDVVALVLQVTDKSKPDDGDRATRKEIDRQHLAKASADAQSIKLADLIHNTESIVKHDKKFAKIYLEEKRLLLQVLTKGYPVLFNMARSSLARGLEELKNNDKDKSE